MFNLYECNNEKCLSEIKYLFAWGKNDFGQTHFPVEYRIEFESYTNEGPYGPGGGFWLWQNPPPQIALGDNHTLISSRNLYRSPMLDYTFPDQFSGFLVEIEGSGANREVREGPGIHFLQFWSKSDGGTPPKRQ